MRIVHVTRSIDAAVGGPAQSVPSLASAQAALGHETSIVFYEWPRGPEAIEEARRNIRGIDRVRLVSVGPPSWRELVFGSRAREKLRSELATADFLHLHDMWQPVLAIAAQLADRAAVPYAVSPRGALNAWSLAQKRFKKRIALALLWGDLLRGAAFLHALNRQEGEQVERLRLGPRVVIEPNGTFADQRLPDRGGFTAAWPVLAGRRFVLFLSRMHMKKGIDILVDAFGAIAPKHPDVDLVIAGPDEGIGRFLPDWVARHGLEGRVHVVGPLYGAAKLAALRDATLFCLPSRDEGFSMAIIEAMAAGLPVVITENCNFPEVEAAGAGRVCTLESAAIAKGLAGLLSDEPLRAASAARAKAFVHSGYTWEAIAERMVAHYGAGSRNVAA